MSYYMIPSRSPVSGFGAVVAAPVPDVEPRVRSWGAPITRAERLQKAFLPGGTGMCDYSYVPRNESQRCVRLYCAQMGIPQGGEFLRGRFQRWILECNCPHGVRPVWCPPVP